MNYCTYWLLSTLDSYCCCLIKYCEREGSCCRNQMFRLRRLELAKLKIQSELSIYSYLQMKRLTKLTFKTWLGRHQRESTRYFRRYTVKNEEIERGEDEKQGKSFDTDRVVAECDFERNQLDRRILYEMLGERLIVEEFPDETSETDPDQD